MEHVLNTHRDLLSRVADDLQAPFFFYDLDALQSHIANLQEWPVKLWYALKANPLSSVISALADQDLGFDVASQGECQQVLKQNVDPSRILVTGPAKTQNDFTYYLQNGIEIFVLESHAQVVALQQVAEQLKKMPKALLRVQLSWEGQEENILGGNAVTPFGLTPEAWSSLSLPDYPNIQFIGLHIFQWGNILDTENLKVLWHSMLEPLGKLAKQLNISYTVLDLGGGLGIPYDKNGQALAAKTVHTLLTELKQSLPGQEIWLELGRYAIGSFGCYVAKVLERKHSRDTELLIMEGGINHIMRPAITQQSFPASLLRSSNTETIPYAIHGPLCTSLDRLGVHELPKDIVPGDHIVFSQAGAYAFTESMPFFLCHTLPGEVVWYKQNLDILRMPENPSDWLR